MMNIQAIGGQKKTLVLTHLRRRELGNLRACEQFWNKTRTVPGDLFAKRVVLTEGLECLFPITKVEGCEESFFSSSGAIDDLTPPKQLGESTHLHRTAVENGFVSPDSNVFVLGGGNFDYCLYSTFKSIMDIKLKQDQQPSNLTFIIPISLIYGSDQISLQDYSSSKNEYSLLLDEYCGEKQIGYSIFINNNEHKKSTGPGKLNVGLFWFFDWNSFFISKLFPATSCNPDSFDRIVAQME